MANPRYGAPGLFGGHMTRDEQVQAGANGTSVRANQQTTMPTPQSTKPKRPCPLSIRDEDCITLGYQPR